MAEVLVTGGSGFIGRHLVRGLLAGGTAVRVLDRHLSSELPQEVSQLEGCVLDAEAVSHAMRGVRCVYHLAGIPHLWTRRKEDFDRVNRRGTEVVLRAAAEQGVARVVHCSTESILLPKEHGGRPIDEGVRPPLRDMPGPYTRSKHGAETAALEAARQGLDVVIVNPTVPIGSGDRNRTPPAAMLMLFLEGRSPFFLDCVLNLLDVRDAAAGLILAAERGRSGERYILGGENLALRELLRRLAALSGRPMPSRSLPAPLALAAATAAEWVADRVTGRSPPATREGVRLALRSAPFDSRKAQQELGYRPRPIDEALSEAVRWLPEAAHRRVSDGAAGLGTPSTGQDAAAVGDRPRRFG